MKEITEDYVSYEIAVLLKEKGFDNEEVSENGGFYCDYKCDGTDIGIVYESEMLNKDLARNEYLRPTHQMALKWLREEKGIYLDIFLDDDSEMPWTYNIHKELRDGTTECVCHHHGNYYPLRIGYEEAVEAALKYSLENLI